MDNKFEIGIIGAGLAGLSLAIQMARAGRSVTLFEKNKFPFHKLCGEYLSLESVPFLEHLGVDFSEIQPATINELLVTNASGKRLSTNLPLGGIGVSRYLLDHILYNIAVKEGVTILENTLIVGHQRFDNQMIVRSKEQEYEVEILISSYGKKSNLIRKETLSKPNKNEYVGIKYHIKLPSHPANQISMHNFSEGYCGVCRLESDWVSLCYLTHTNNLKAAGNKIKTLEEEVLFKNKHIKEVFENADFLYTKPIAVSNINFKRKRLVHQGVFYCGDAAGLITPLCGNGMSMALHSSLILGDFLVDYFDTKISRDTLEKLYIEKWKKQFSTRMKAGRTIQRLFRYEKSADITLSVLNTLPILQKPLISITRGKPFYK